MGNYAPQDTKDSTIVGLIDIALDELESDSTSGAGEGMDGGVIPVITDHFLIRRIGRGSYGEVWLARNIMGEYRAVKIVHQGDFDGERPFDRELEGIRKFEPISRKHESQLDILHVGRTDGFFYYVMELADDAADGTEIDPETYQPRTLRQLLKEKGRIEVEECVRIAANLCEALSNLHKAGLVHRDIKLSNIVFVNGRPKLADIGLVASIDATLSVVGTEGYLPPEGPGSTKADIYSLGKVLYETVTGNDRRMYPDWPQDLHGDEALEFKAVIDRACETRAIDRYDSVDEMLVELGHLKRHESVRWSRTMEKRVRILKRAAVVGGALLALSGIGYVYQKQQTEKAEQLAQQLTQTTENLRDRTNELKQKTAQAESSASKAIAANYQLHNQNAIRFMKKGDLQEAALWSHSALQMADPDSEEAWAQYYRLDTLLSSLPEVLDHVDASSFGYNSRALVSTRDDQPDYLVNAGSRLLLVDPLTGEHKRSMASVEAGISEFIGAGKLLKANLDSHLFEIRDVATGTKSAEFLVRQNVRMWFGYKGGEYVLVSANIVTNESIISVLDCFSGETGALIWSKEFDGRLSSMTMSESGQFVACGIQPKNNTSGAGSEIFLLDGNTGTTLHRIEKESIADVEFSKDGQTLLYQINSPTGKVYGRLFACPIVDAKLGDSWQIDESLPDGLIRIPGNNVYHWNPTSFGQKHPDRVVIARGNSFIHYDLKSREVIQTLPGLTDQSLSAWDLSPDERFMAIANQQNEIWFYDLVEGGDWQRIVKHYADVSDLNFTSTPGRLLVTGSDRSVRLISMPAAADIPDAKLFDLELFSNEPLHWNPATPGHVAIIGKTNSNQQSAIAYTLDLQSLELENFLPEAANVAWLARNFHSNLVAVGTSTNGFEIWNANDQKRVFHDPKYTNLVYKLMWNPSGSMLAGATRDRRVFVLKYGKNPHYIFERDFKLSSPLGGDADNIGIEGMDWDPKGEYLCITSGKEKLLWDVNADQVIEVSDSSGRAYIASFSPDGNRLLLYIGSNILIGTRSNRFSMDRPVSLRATGGQHTPDIAWSPGSDKLVTVQLSVKGVSQAYLWNLKARPNGYDSSSMDGTNLIDILSFDEGKGDCLLEHDTQISSVAFSRDGLLLATGDISGTVNIWSAASAELIAIVKKDGGGISELSFSPDGRLLLCRMENNSLQLHETGIDVANPERSNARLRLLCGGIRDAQGRFIPADADQLLADLDIVKNAGRFSSESRLSKLIDRHVSHLGDIVFQGDVSKPLTHVEQLIKLEPENWKWKELMERLINVSIPARDSNAPPVTVDLSDHYNANLHEWSLASPSGTGFTHDNTMSPLPAGVHEFLGVQFDIRGIVHVGSNDESQSLQKYFRYPPSIDGIKVDQRANEVHFLHTAIWGVEEKGEVEQRMGHYTIKLDDGSTHEFPIIFNRSVGEWWEGGPETKYLEPEKLPEAKVAWTSTSAATLRVGDGKKLHLYMTTWKNPHPDRIVTEIDLVSARARPIPFLVAITVEP